ncbi:glycosyltransferase [Candidatus Pelagibacter sp.]|uniref:glycosyltransferase n=1 Tax=Candidatus Pelagibacter sp. TaxID=2024849 RepID=UPI003F85D78F
MRDLIIFIPSIEGGGVEKNLFYITNYIESKFKNIYLITADKFERNTFGKNIKLITPNTTYYKNKNRFVKNIICSYLLFKNFKKRKVLVLSLQSNFFSIISSKVINAKVIIRLNTSPEKYISNIFKKILFKFLYSFADEIIVNCHDFKKNLYKNFYLNSKVIFNPIKMDKTKKKIDFFKDFKELKIISIGRLTNQKNQIILLKALYLLKNKFKIKFKLYLIGKGYNYNLLKNFIYKNKLQKNVKLAGYKKNASSYIKSSDLFILSSNYEGLPNTLIEAQAACVPIISSNCPTGPKEILMNGRLGDLFNPGDYKNLCKKIYNYYKNRKLLKKKSILAKKYLYRFDYQDNLNKYVIVIMKYIKN